MLKTLTRQSLLVLLAAMAALPALAGERAMSDKEKQELTGAVGKVLAFFESDLGLKARAPVELEFTTQEKILEQSREEAAKQEAESREANQAHELLLKKLGLVPRDFSIEQWETESHPRLILAYYSPEKKKLYLLETLARGQREPVLAHELMHAVEDQHFSIEEYIRGGSEAAAKAANRSEGAHHPTFDDGAFARKAVIEGHAMYATVQYLWSKSSRYATFGMSSRQEFIRQVESAFPSMSKENKELVKKTPLYLSASAEFPYWTGGFEFVTGLSRSGGPKLAYNEPIARPPASAREIMMPENYLKKEPVPQMDLPKLGALLGEEHKLLWIETAGQLDVALMAEQFAGKGKAGGLAPKWRGGRWYLFTTKGESKGLTTKDVELVYVSQWQNKDAAEDFAEVYAKAVGKKYPAAGAATRDGNRRVWQTEEGTISVESAGERVLVLESFDAAAAEKLRQALLSRAPSSAAADSVVR